MAATIWSLAAMTKLEAAYDYGIQISIHENDTSLCIDYPFSAGTDFRRQNITSLQSQILTSKSIHALKELNQL